MWKSSDARPRRRLGPTPAAEVVVLLAPVFGLDTVVLSSCGCLTRFRIAYRTRVRRNRPSLGTCGLHAGAVGISPRRCVVGFAARHATGATGGRVERTVVTCLRLAGVGIVTSPALVSCPWFRLH